MTKIHYPIAAIVIAAGLQGCSSLPERVDTLDQARASVQALQREPLARDVAPTQLENAQAALRRAEGAYEERESLETVEHHAYVALRNAQIAEQLVGTQRAREELDEGEAERTRVQLQAREREAERAEREARSAQALAEERAADVGRQAREIEEERQRATALEQELAGLRAQQTPRGLVLTLDDVLFETNRAVLTAGADATVQRLAQFLNDYPERRIMIEGHTDSVGTEEYNLELSERRAQAVRNALLDRSIPVDRIVTRGLGEAYPVASNNDAAGRQMNRRVEIVISDQDGRFVETSRTPER
jgi:outer membrane protein OmpA-like peptidoglycan-associated protein